MKCLQCQNEVRDDAKFCPKCGFNFSTVAPVQMQAPRPTFCTKCGNSLSAGVKFCTVCGTPVGSVPTPAPIPTPAPTPAPAPAPIPTPTPEPEDEATMVLEEEPEEKAPIVLEKEPESEPEDEATMVLEEEPEDEATMVLDEYEQPSYQQPVNQQPVNQQPTYQQPINQQPTYQQPINQQPINQQPINQQPTYQQPTSTPEKKKGGNGVVIAIAVVAVLAIIGIAVGLMFAKGIIKLPGSLETESTESLTETASEVAGENATAENQETGAEEVDVEALVADIDASVDEAKSMFDDDTQLLNGMEMIRTALDNYLAKSEEVGGYSDVIEDRITATYGDYVEGVTKRLNFLSQQSLSGSVYTQAMNEVNDVLDYADTISAAGYNVDELVQSLNSTKNQFDTDYRNNMIETFNEFTTREQWSRTEAWNLMSSADQMFDSDDMDNPIRTRYEYALAYYIQKEAETQVNEGTITSKGAAQKIARVLEDTDYNLMLIYEYMYYMDDAGEDYSEVEDAYYEVLYQIYDTQGIDLTYDIDIYQFWSFNNFDEYSDTVEDGDYNGLSSENREYARELFSQISFVD